MRRIMKIEMNLKERRIVIDYDEGEAYEIEQIIGVSPIKRIANQAIESRFEKKKEEIK